MKMHEVKDARIEKEITKLSNISFGDYFEIGDTIYLKTKNSSYFDWLCVTMSGLTYYYSPETAVTKVKTKLIILE